MKLDSLKFYITMITN